MFLDHVITVYKLSTIQVLVANDDIGKNNKRNNQQPSGYTSIFFVKDRCTI